MDSVVPGARSNGDGREHDERSVATSFDLNRHVNLLASHSQPVTPGAQAVRRLKQLIDLALRERRLLR